VREANLKRNLKKSSSSLEADSLLKNTLKNKNRYTQNKEIQKFSQPKTTKHSISQQKSKIPKAFETTTKSVLKALKNIEKTVKRPRL